MPLLKSLLCVTGFDNRSRFIFIHLSCYFTFLLCNALFSAHPIISFLFLVTLTFILTLSTKRRLSDANLMAKWSLIPSSTFVVTGLAIIFINSTLSYILLLLPIVTSCALLTYPSAIARDYCYGYKGSIDLSQFKKGPSINRPRIEPSFAHSATNARQYEKEQDSLPPSEHSNPSKKYKDFGEEVRIWVFNNKKISLYCSMSLFVILSITFIYLLLSSSSKTTDVNSNQLDEVGAPQKEEIRRYSVVMPDSFSIMISEHDGVVIQWEGDESSEMFLWQQLTTQGDDTCKVLKFNNKDEYRPVNVNIENSSDYFANFSPLDTKSIIKNIAHRNSFSLCDFNFSLKGSQATLGKHPYYQQLLE